MTDDDKALATARQLLNGRICDCGHLAHDHGADATAPCQACDCPQYRPVVFTVVAHRGRRE